MRDPILEREMFDLAGAEEASPSFRRLVTDRLALGDERFGTSFMGRDNLAEALPEGADIAAYGMLHLHRVRASLTDGEFQEMKMHVVAMVKAAVEADLATRRAIAFVRSLSTLGE